MQLFQNKFWIPSRYGIFIKPAAGQIKRSKEEIKTPHIYYIKGDWGTGKNDSSSEIVDYLQTNHPHLINLLVEDTREINNDATFVLELYKEITKNTAIGASFKGTHLNKFLNDFYNLSEDLKSVDLKLYENLIEFYSFNSIESTLADDKQAMMSGKDTSNKEDFALKIRTTYDRLNDQNILINKQDCLVRALFNDLFDAIFPLDEEFRSLSSYYTKLEPGNLPVHITISILQSDLILGGLQEFLTDTLVNFNSTAKISNLENPQYEDNSSKRSIKDYIVIHPIISTCSGSIDGDSNMISLIQKGFLNKNQVKSLVQNLGLDPDTTLERAWHLYNGHPKLTNWHLNNLAQGRKEKEFIGEINSFTQDCFGYLPENIQYLIYVLAVFGSCDLRVINIVTESKTSYWYDLLSQYYFINQTEGNFSLKKPFRLLASYLEFDDNVTGYLSNLAESYTAISHELAEFTDEDLNKFVLLSYFDRFSLTALAEYQIDGSTPLHDLSELIDTYPHRFVKHQYTYSLESKSKQLFRDFAVISVKSEEQNGIAIRLWDIFEETLTAQKLQNERLRKLRTEELTGVSNTLRKSNNAKKKLDEEISQISARQKKINKELGQFAEKKNDKLAATFLSFGLLSLVFYLIGEWFFSNFFDHDETIHFASYVVLLIAIIFLLLSSKLIYRLLVGFIKKDKIEDLKNKRTTIDNDLITKKNQRKQVVADEKAAEAKLTELNRDIAALHKELEVIKGRLEEPFISKDDYASAT